jgi:hypothetical protein
MTVPTSTAKSGPYAGSGTTGPFTVGFRFLENSHLQVIRTSSTGVDTTLALTTDYTVSGAGGASGSVTLVAALAVGQQLTVIRNIPFTQDADYVQNDAFPAESHERALDKLTMQTQQLLEAVDRAAKLPVTSTADSDELVADITLLANNITGLTAIAGDLTNINIVASDLAEPVSEINTVAVAIANVDAVGNNISNVNAVAGNQTNINAVVANATNINTVAGNNANVTTVAGISANVTTVAGASSAVNTVATNIAAVNSAATNMAAIIAAPTQAAAAAASASAAAASAASGMYSAVQDKSANYTVVAGDAGDLIRVTTTGGVRTITLPAISTVGDGFKVAVVKWTGDANAVNIARSNSDTINGATSASIGSQYSSTTFVADAETSQWFAVSSGLGSTNVSVDAFNGTGSQTAFTLSGDPGTENNTQVFVSGVYQEKDTYSVIGTTLTFSAAPPSGTTNIEVVWTQPLAIGVPGNDTVGTSKLQTGSVTPEKFSADAQYSMQGFRNRIINGGMVIDQRNAGAAFGTSINGYTLDRWAVNTSVSGKINGGQNYNAAVLPLGFSNYLGVQSQSAYSVLSGDYFAITQTVEGFNISDLAWGTVNAQTVTLSFRVYSSLIGTFGGSLRNGATNRSYPFTYTISAANTWATVSVTIPGDTSGTWLTTNGSGVAVNFGLGVGVTYSGAAGSWAATNYLSATGATSVVGTSGATFYITGVQLEAGTVASPFERRDYGRELMMCQRYYEVCLAQAVGSGAASNSFGTGVTYAVVKRATPTNTQILNNSGYTQSGVSATTSGYIGDTTSVLVYRTSNASFAQFSERFSAASEL